LRAPLQGNLRLLEACGAYAGHAYAGPIDLVISADLAGAGPGRPVSVARMGCQPYVARWKELTGGVRVHQVGREHATMFSGASADEMARLCSLLLAEGSGPA